MVGSDRNTSLQRCLPGCHLAVCVTPTGKDLLDDEGTVLWAVIREQVNRMQTGALN